ncbi:MAG: methylamine utilization protein MauE [Pseudomonadota bacterium]|nr:methylamine utilization protein MauE [Pseudomonadota bacterium]
MNEIALAIRVLVALVFLTAALGKTRHRLAFQGVVANYRLIPDFAVPTFALLLPLVEAAVAAALLFAPPSWPEVSAAVLLILFAAAMAINISRGRRRIDCGCFQSALKQTLSWTLVGRNVGLALLLAVPATVSEAALPDLGAVEALLIGTVLFVLLQSMNILWSVVPAWRQRGPLATGDGK